MISNIKADFIGTIAGVICLIHCATTPVLFLAKACSVTCCNNTPVWWQIVDYIFIIVSFFAIHNSTKIITSRIIKISFWGSWLTLFLSILNESFQLLKLSEWTIYIPAFAIIVLHIYSYKVYVIECNCTKNITTYE